MEFKKRTIIWEENNVPPKNYLWVKADNKVYEYSLLDNKWIESKTFQIKDNSTVYSSNETSSEVSNAIQAYVNKQESAGKPVSPTSTITVNYEEIPEEITLPETTHPVTLKGNFSQNDLTTIESNGEIEKVTINNTGDPSNIIIDLPSTTATLSGNYDTVTVKAISDNTLKVTTSANINHLILLKGTVVVNNATVEDNIKKVTVVEGIVKVNEIEINSENLKLVNAPGYYKFTEDVSANNATFGILANGHYIYDLNEHKLHFVKGGVLVRGITVNLDIKGNGEIDYGSNPLIWLSDKESKITIYDGKFYSGNSNECIYSEKGTIEILGGEFHNVHEEGQKNYLLNCLDANYKSGIANIIVKGGKFYGFDPSNCESEGPETNFVAEGYQSIDKGDYFEVEKI